VRAPLAAGVMTDFGVNPSNDLINARTRCIKQDLSSIFKRYCQLNSGRKQ